MFMCDVSADCEMFCHRHSIDYRRTYILYGHSIFIFYGSVRKFLIKNSEIVSQHGASDSVANFSALINPADVQNVSCLRLCGRHVCLKSYA